MTYEECVKGMFMGIAIGDALGMYAKLLDPRQYAALGLDENTYVVAAAVMLAVLSAYAFKRTVGPILRRNRVTWAVVETAGFGVVIALVFVFLRPINQFIYFQF